MPAPRLPVLVSMVISTLTLRPIRFMGPRRLGRGVLERFWLVRLARLALRAQLAPQGRRVRLALRAQPARLVLLARLVLRVRLVLRGRSVRLARPGQQDRRA